MLTFLILMTSSAEKKSASGRVNLFIRISNMSKQRFLNGMCFDYATRAILRSSRVQALTMVVSCILHNLFYFLCYFQLLLIAFH